MARFSAKAKDGLAKNFYIYVLIFFFLLTGFSAAVFTYNQFSPQRAQWISNYIYAFMETARGGVPFFAALWQALSINVPALAVVVLAGRWLLTCPIGFLVIGIKGFSIGITFMALLRALPFFSWLALFICCVLVPCLLVVPCYFNACRLSVLYAVAKAKVKTLPAPDQAEYIKFQVQTLIAMALALAVQSGIQSLMFGVMR